MAEIRNPYNSNKEQMGKSKRKSTAGKKAESIDKHVQLPLVSSRRQTAWEPKIREKTKVKVPKAQPSGQETIFQPVMVAGETEVTAACQNDVNATAASLKLEPDVNGLANEPIMANNGTLADVTRVTGVAVAQLPFAAIKVRKVVGKIVNLITEIIDNKVIVQGLIHEQLYFVGTDGIVHHLGDEIPFSDFIDLPGIRPGMNVHVTAEIEAILTELAPDGLSVVKKIIVELFVKVTKTIQTGLRLGNGPLLLLEQVVGEGTNQTLLNNDFILAAPALKVDEVVGEVQELQAEVIADQVIIQGILHKQIFLIDPDNRGYLQTENLPFSAVIDIPGAAPGMSVEVKTRLETLLYELITPTLLRQRAVINFNVIVTEATREIVTLGDGPLFKVTVWVNEGTVQDLRETVITLPVPASAIRNIVAQVRQVTTEVVLDKVIVQGNIHKQVYFVDVNNRESHLAEDIPFAVFLDLPGAVPGDRVEIAALVEGLFYNLETPTQLRQRVVTEITAVVGREAQYNLVLDAGPLWLMEIVVNEGTKQVLVVRREPIIPPPPPPPSKIVVSELIIVDPGSRREAGQQIVLRNQVTLPAPAISVKEINGTIVDQRYFVVPSGVVVEGAVLKDIAFVAFDNVVHRVVERVPFSIMVPVPEIDPNVTANVNVLIESIDFMLDPTGATIDQTLVLQATVTEQTLQTIATVVTDVSGTGVVQTKIRVIEWVLLADGQIARREFDVVTAVAGPGIAGIEKAVLLLNVIENGVVVPQMVEVVTKVILSE